MTLRLDIFDHHLAIVGRTGSGKSFTARGLVERWLDEQRRVCIIDPTDVWYGLRSNATGDGPGYPVVVFGGDHGDVPIGERSGSRLAEIIGSRNMPAVVCTAEMTGGERHRFMAEFLPTLYRINRMPLHLVVDEADDIAPQNPLPENRRMLGDFDRIVRRGRVRGFRVTMITQRPAVLNKNVLAQASTLIAMRLPAPQDRKAIEDWVKGQADVDQAREMLNSLASLARGEGWVWAPEEGVLLRTLFPPIKTFDSMRTPEHGEEIEPPSALASVELGDLAALLTPDATDENSRDKPGQDEIAEMRRELTALRSVDANLTAAEKRGYERGLEQSRKYIAFLESRMIEVRGLLDVKEYPSDVVVVDPERKPPEAILQAVDGAGSSSETNRRQRAPAVERPLGPVGQETRAQPGAPAKRVEASHLPVSAQKMLTVLQRGLHLTWAQTATLAGLKPRGGSFNTGRKALRDGRHVLEVNGLVAANGVAAAQVPSEKLMEWWRSALPATPGRILDQLHRQGKWTSKERLAEFLGMAPRGGAWNTALALLRQNNLIEAKDDQLRATIR